MVLTLIFCLILIMTALSVHAMAEENAESGGSELYAGYTASPYLSQTNTQKLHEAGKKGKSEDGTPVRVVVIDTGVDTDNEAFADEEGNPIFSPLSYNATEKKTVAEYGLSVIEDQYVTGLGYHGTSVCGLIASRLTDYPGIAPECELVVVKCVWNCKNNRG